MKKIYILLGLIVLFGLLYFFFGKNNLGGEQIACTADALVCPDGSGVGRTGPNCEFSACPNEGFFEGEIREQGSSFIIAVEAPEGLGGEITYALPLDFSRISNVIGTLLNKEVRVTGKFRTGNILEVESIKELDEANIGVLGVGETEFVSGVTITLNKIIEDSRCPVDAVCIQAGRLVAEIKLQSDTDSETLNIGTDKPKINFDLFTITLEAVAPKPVSVESMATRNYLLTFRVEK